MRESLQNPSRLYVCSFPDCKASYNKAWKLDAHLCKHTGSRPFECQREGCGKAFCSRFHLERHNLTHTRERPFKCSEEGCALAFTTNSNLRKHVARAHEREGKQYVCTFEGCDRAFKKNNQLRSHMCEHKDFLPIHKCTFEGCSKQFTFPSKLRRHEKVHLGYPCSAEGCAFVGKTWTELTKHRKEEHRVMVRCDQCGKMFRDAWFLRQHERVHEEQRQVFRCPRGGCPRSYTTLFNLQSHIASFHEERRPFACPHAGCGRTFAMKQSLQRHTVAHDPEKKKQKKSHPKRSLVSRLSGYKSKGSCQSKSSEQSPIQSAVGGASETHTGTRPAQ